MKKQFHLQDIILITMIALIFGAIFVGTDYLYNVLTIAVGPFANEILFGLWIMAGPLAGFMLRIPGAGFLGEFLAAVGEMFFGGQWGASTLISGAVQGIAVELGFTLTGYRFYNWLTLTLSTLTSTIITFGWDMFRNGYAAFSPRLLVILFIVF